MVFCIMKTFPLQQPLVWALNEDTGDLHVHLSLPHDESVSSVTLSGPINIPELACVTVWQIDLDIVNLPNTGEFNNTFHIPLHEFPAGTQHLVVVKGEKPKPLPKDWKKQCHFFLMSK